MPFYTIAGLSDHNHLKGFLPYLYFRLSGFKFSSFRGDRRIDNSINQTTEKQHQSK
jgi:hypothetical protein